MKQATVHIRLSREHEVTKKRVTPIEVMLLIAEHAKNLGDLPIKKESISNEQDTTKFVQEQQKNENTGVIVFTDVEVPDKDRTIDQELDRLRTIYGPKKVGQLNSQVREMPTTFDQAIERGPKISLSVDKMATIASVNL